MTTGAPVIWWIRQDLRVTDNAALLAALTARAPVLPVYVLDDEAAGPWAPGGAGRWWLHHSLASLAESLRTRGASLILRRGRAEEILPALAAEVGARAVHAGRLYEPWARARDKRVAAALAERGVAIEGARTALLFEPWEIRTKTGGPYGVYTPFSRACFAAPAPAQPLPAPERIPCPDTLPASDDLASWNLLPTRPDWAGGLREAWRPGEAGAAARIEAFTAAALARYDEARNRPDLPGTSGLSPHLHWGEISPASVWHAALAAGAAHGAGTETPLAERSSRAQGLAEGAHRLSHRRCGDAPALAHGLDAQPRADDRRLLPGEAPSAALAGGGGLVLGHAG